MLRNSEEELRHERLKAPESNPDHLQAGEEEALLAFRQKGNGI